MAIDEHAATWHAVDKLDEIRKILGVSVHDDVVGEVRKLKAIAEGQDGLILELKQELECVKASKENTRTHLADAIRKEHEGNRQYKIERDSAELAAIYFAKRLECQYHVTD